MRSATAPGWLGLAGLAIGPRGAQVVLLTSMVLALLRASPAEARASSAAVSLGRCENAVRREAGKFEQGTVKAMATCLQTMAKAVVQNQSAPATAATTVAAACMKSFRKLNDSRGRGLSLSEKMSARIAAECDPNSPGVRHTLDDVTGKEVGLVAQQIKTVDIDAWCQRFGGDGSIDTVAEWIACLQQSHECAASTAISAEYPRAAEWLGLIIPAMSALTSPADDPGRVADAVAAAETATAAIEGGSDDDAPGIHCGRAGSTCGDGVKDGTDECDGPDLGGATCTDLGFAGGTLACGPSCRFDTSSCRRDLCGNGVRDGIESCDGTDLGGQTCAGLGFLGGTLACGPSCRFDTSGCRTDLCGNGVRDGIESCDGADLGGQTCAGLGFLGGTLACGPLCEFDTSGCRTDLCGNGVRDGIESCDGADLGGQTCAGLGFGGGTLGCTASCNFDLAGCTPLFPATGQTTCWNTGGTPVACTGTGQDGDIQAGATLSYTDNGDGTITDDNTGLMWEKKSDDGSIHDKDTLYNWANAFAVHVAGLNSGGGFAGHTDWRLPNAKELQAIVSYENVNPSVAAAFNTGCTPGCTVLTCSCTAASFYWSSTSSIAFPSYAWYVNFSSGNVFNDAKVSGRFVRAVRGGS